MRIVGIENKKGEYQGRQYNNYIFHCLEADENVIGKARCMQVKFKPVNLQQIVPLDKLESLINKDVVNVFYDKYGNAISMQFKN